MLQQQQYAHHNHQFFAVPSFQLLSFLLVQPAFRNDTHTGLPNRPNSKSHLLLVLVLLISFP